MKVKVKIEFKKGKIWANMIGLKDGLKETSQNHKNCTTSGNEIFVILFKFVGYTGVG